VYKMNRKFNGARDSVQTHVIRPGSSRLLDPDVLPIICIFRKPVHWMAEICDWVLAYLKGNSDTRLVSGWPDGRICVVGNLIAYNTLSS
jgi:hypothetical protein